MRSKPDIILRNIICVFSFSVFLSLSARAEEGLPGSTGVMIESNFKDIGMQRDPFSVTESLAVQARREGSYDFYPSEENGLLPKLKLRGYIEDRNKDPMALLDVEGQGVYLVRKGDKVGLQTGGRHTVIKVKEITNLSVFIELGTLGQVVIIK